MGLFAFATAPLLIIREALALPGSDPILLPVNGCWPRSQGLVGRPRQTRSLQQTV